MKGIYLITYSVRGIKNLDEWADLSFYKKRFDKKFDLSKYNLKGIYGPNGAGKSALITSVKILRNLITDPYYLNNSQNQEKICALINRKTGRMDISVQFLSVLKEEMKLYEYKISLGIEKDRCSICCESLQVKDALSCHSDFKLVYSAEKGILHLAGMDQKNETLIEMTKNLLTIQSLPSVALEKMEEVSNNMPEARIITDLFYLVLFGASIYVFLEKEDKHENYYLSRQTIASRIKELDELLDKNHKKEGVYQPRGFFELSSEPIEVLKTDLPVLEKTIYRLCRFLQIFKNDLQNITVEKREDRTRYICTLKMNYEDYSVDAEFESNGIKKLIRLYAYIQKMINGNIVFIDELDSNLHDVYLCALLEYMMNFGKGQLCFTSHNIGPMDILKKNKMSISFLSADRSVYSWTNNGNYSPSKLYRNGMITGSPFNVNDFDFISVFDTEEE